jgi:hypothetical protein
MCVRLRRKSQMAICRRHVVPMESGPSSKGTVMNKQTHHAKLILPDTSLWRTLENRLLERIQRAGYTRKFISTTQLGHMGNWYGNRNRTSIIFLGGHSITDTTKKIKYLDQEPYTAGEMAREYASYCADKAEIKLTRQRIRTENAFAPLVFYGPVHKGLYAYVDIRACHWSLFQYGWLDLSYSIGEKTFGTGLVPFCDREEFGLQKEVRNTLFGLFQKVDAWTIQYGKPIDRTMITEYYRPDIAAYTLSTLNGIVKDALKHFPIQGWLTDGAILPYAEANGLIQFLKEEWGITAEIDAYGDTQYLSSNCYSVGPRRTKQFLKSLHAKEYGDPCKTLMPKTDVKYLKETRKWLLHLSESSQNILNI